MVVSKPITCARMRTNTGRVAYVTGEAVLCEFVSCQRRTLQYYLKSEKESEARDEDPTDDSRKGGAPKSAAKKDSALVLRETVGPKLAVAQRSNHSAPQPE